MSQKNDGTDANPDSMTNEDYEPAYRVGDRYSGKNVRYETVEPELQRAYEVAPSSQRLRWDKARGATRDAWARLEESRSGKVNRDQQ